MQERTGKPADELSRDELLAYLAARRKYLSASTLNTVVCSLKYYYREVARRLELVVDIPNKKGRLNIPPGQSGSFAQWRRERFRQHWVVYAKAPFHGPKAVLEYLGRYTHKVAISNHRITNLDKHRVFIFRYKDYRQGGKPKNMSLQGTEFLRRFCLHIFYRNCLPQSSSTRLCP